MKRAALIIALACSTAFAAPDVGGALPDFAAAVDKIKKLEAANDNQVGLIGRMVGEGRDKDAALQAEKDGRAEDARKAKEQIRKVTARGNSTLGMLMALIGIGVGVGGGFFGFAILKKMDIGAGSAVAGAVLLSIGLAVIHYGSVIALYAIIGCPIAVIAFVGWVVVRAKKRETAGINHANVIDALEAAGLPAEWATRARALQYKMSGSMGEYMTAEASGKTVKEVRADGKTAVTLAEAAAGTVTQ